MTEGEQGRKSGHFRIIYCFAFSASKVFHTFYSSVLQKQKIQCICNTTGDPWDIPEAFPGCPGMYMAFESETGDGIVRNIATINLFYACAILNPFVKL